MISLKTILVPTDFGEPSRQALEYAGEIARKFGSTVNVLHVVQDLVTIAPEPGLVFASAGDLLEELRASGKKQLQTFGDEESTSGIEVVRDIAEGQPFVEIIRYAKRNSVDLIIMGTHGRSGISHMLLGSVAEKVVRKANCPVLTVRPDDHQFEKP